MNRKKRRLWRAVIICAVILVIIICGKAFWGKDKIPSVTVGTPERGTIIEKIPANGKIRPVTEVKISPDVSGEIIELNVQEGDYIQAGELIIKIKQDVYISLRDRATASLNATKAQYQQQQTRFHQAKLNMNRSSTLYKSKAISEQEYESAVAEYNMAKEELNAAEFNIQSATASLNEAEENLLKTTIYSPISGIVSVVNVEKGERVVGTSQMAGTEILRIADFDKMEVLVDVNENDIIKVSLGDTADIDVDAYPGQLFKGVVTKIANSAKNLSAASSNDVTNFEVTIGILKESYSLLLEKSPIPFRPGMSASVEIETETKENALKLPLQSVTADESVFIYDKLSGTVKKAKIKTGIQDINNIEITDGITSDSLLVVTGPYGTITNILNEGTKVNATIKEPVHE